MNHYPTDAFSKVSALLEASALELGASAFAVGGQAVPLHVALDAVGPMSWLLALHAGSMQNLLTLGGQGAGRDLPVTCIPDESAPFGNQVVVQPSVMPLSIAFNFLDTALEHAICLGLRDLNYTHAEWMALPEDQRVIPLEPYFEDMRQNWITDSLESGRIGSAVADWPELLDMASLNKSMAQGISQKDGSNAIKFHSAR